MTRNEKEERRAAVLRDGKTHTISELAEKYELSEGYVRNLLNHGGRTYRLGGFAVTAVYWLMNGYSTREVAKKLGISLARSNAILAEMRHIGFKIKSKGHKRPVSD